jgi:hypothetical protein
MTKTTLFSIFCFCIFILSACNAKIKDYNKLVNTYNSTESYRTKFDTEFTNSNADKGDSLTYIKAVDSLKFMLISNIATLKAMNVPSDMNGIRQHFISSDSALLDGLDDCRKIKTDKLTPEETIVIGNRLISSGTNHGKIDSVMQLYLAAYRKANNIELEK